MSAPVGDPAITQLEKWIVTWSGIPGGGVNVFWLNGGVANHGGAALRNIYNEVRTILPPDVTITFPSSVETYDVQSGAFKFAVPVTPEAAVPGISSGGYAGAAGACIAWHTVGTAPAIKPPHLSHKIKGRTFLVPLASNAFDTDGTLTPTAIGHVNQGVTYCLAGIPGNLYIYCRPRYDKTTGAVIREGGASSVVAGTVNDQCAVLTSRRH